MIQKRLDGFFDLGISVHRLVDMEKNLLVLQGEHVSEIRDAVDNQAVDPPCFQ